MLALAENRVDALIERANTLLPATVEKLNQFIIIGKERLNAQKAKIRAIEKTGMAIEAKEAALEDAQDMADILLDAEVRLGEILEGIEPQGNTLTSVGGRKATLPPDITHKQSHQAQTLSQNREVVEQAKAEARETGEIPTAAHVYKLIKNPHVSFNSGENEWYTPPEYIEAARKVMGNIDLDPASSDIANRTVSAIRYFTAEDNGLTKTWAGKVWMNPPYGQPLISQFSETITRKYAAGEIEQACVLVNNATETAWFQILLNSAAAVCFIKGRIKYLNKTGEAAGAPLQGQAVLYMGNKVKDFSDSFAPFGVVLIHG